FPADWPRYWLSRCAAMLAARFKSISPRLTANRRTRRKEARFNSGFRISDFGFFDQSLLLRKWDWRTGSAGVSPARRRRSQAGEGEARTVPGNFHALWRRSAAWGLTSAATVPPFLESALPPALVTQL